MHTRLFRSRGMFSLNALALVLWPSFALPAQSPLTLDAAVDLALGQAPLIERHRALAAGLEAEAVAEGQWPDPTLQMGLLNFPTDTFHRGQEPMTQLQIGVAQAFPRGDSLRLKSARSISRAQAQYARARARAQEVTRSVRQVWLELQYWLLAEQLVGENRSLFSDLVDISSRQYAAGRYNQQDVVRAELELSALDDRLTEIATHQDTQRAELSRWIGERARDALHQGLFVLPELSSRERLAQTLSQHPSLEAAMAEVTARQKAVDLARQAYKPEFKLGVSYGSRAGRGPDGVDRPDFASATVSMDLPLFRAKRQDQRLAAAQHRAGAAKLARDERFLELQRMLGEDYARWKRLGERLELYRSKLLPQAERNAEASLSAYQNDRTDFTTLVRARIKALETRLSYLRLQAERSKAHARLLYLAGEQP